MGQGVHKLQAAPNVKQGGHKLQAAPNVKQGDQRIIVISTYSDGIPYGEQEERDINPLTPELNPSAQRCLRYFLMGILLLEPCISLIYA
jgi:hypothetical protein